MHPVSPILAAGRLFVLIEGTAPKRFDLARNPHYALHALPPQLSASYDEFEFNISGRATRVDRQEPWASVSAAERARGRAISTRPAGSLS